MLEYGLVATPESDQYWFIKASEYSPEMRYLTLRRDIKSRRGKVNTTQIHEKLISSYLIQTKGFGAAVREAAVELANDVTVNFNLPTGRVV
jgi:hypothetical protein